MCGSDETHPYPERSSPTTLSTSGHASYKGRSCIKINICKTGIQKDLTKSWSFRGDRIQRNFLRRTAASRCKSNLTCQKLTPSPSSECCW